MGLKFTHVVYAKGNYNNDTWTRFTIAACLHDTPALQLELFGVFFAIGGLAIHHIYEITNFKMVANLLTIKHLKNFFITFESFNEVMLNLKKIYQVKN